MVKARRVLLHDDIGSESGSNTMDAQPYESPFRIHSLGGWETRPVVLRFEERVPASVRTGVVNAARTWNEAIGYDFLLFEGETPVFRGALYDRLNDTVSTVAVERHWCRTSKPSMVLGTTVWDNGKSDKTQITTADLVLNAEHYALDDAMQATALDERQIVDVESLALHELGHLLGLAHSMGYEGNSVMQPSLYIGPGLSSRKLFDLDIARIRFLYTPGAEPPPVVPPPPPPPYVPSGPYTPPDSGSYPTLPLPPPCDWESDE